MLIHLIFISCVRGISLTTVIRAGQKATISQYKHLLYYLHMRGDQYSVPAAMSDSDVTTEQQLYQYPYLSPSPSTSLILV